MPTYTIYDKSKDEQYEVFCKWSELQEMLAKDENLYTRITGAPSLVHESGTNLKVDNGFREVISKIKNTYKINSIKDY